MTEPRKEYVMTGYDNNRQAFIIEYYENGRYIGQFWGWLDHKKREFKLYPKKPAMYCTLPNIRYLSEDKVKSRR